MLSLCFLDVSVGEGAFVIGLSQISSFLYYLILKKYHLTLQGDII